MKNIVALDTETTGLSPKNDHILQLSAVKFNPETFETIATFDHYIKPVGEYSITDGAFQAHGLTKEFIDQNGVSLANIADEFIEFIRNCDILGYNSNHFDIQFIDCEFNAIGRQIDWMGRKFYDAFSMECRFSPRDLSSIYLKYTGKAFEDAHNSLNDVNATIEVFKRQLETYHLDYQTVSEWEENNLTSPEGSVRKANDGILVFAVGKHKDEEFIQVLRSDPSYIEWAAKNLFSPYTKTIIREYYNEHK